MREEQTTGRRSEAMGRLSGRVAIVTGGAGVGIGSASSTRLAREGAAVVVADIDETSGERLVTELVADGHCAMFQHCDVTRPEDLEAVVQQAVDAYGGLDIMHNHAIGPWAQGYVGDLAVEAWQTGVHNVLSSVFYGCHAAIPALIERGGGSIINTTSCSGLGSQRTHAIYSTSKAAVIALSQCVAWEYGGVGIRCNAIAPGITGHHVAEKIVAFGAYPTEQELLTLHALGRVISPDEIASMVAFLAGDESSAVTGALLLVDAGASARVGEFVGLAPYANAEVGDRHPD
jgi:NAD(P)-dependent dehydrogenase (short-subunit alcohol dehydrogenase family)